MQLLDEASNAAAVTGDHSAARRHPDERAHLVNSAVVPGHGTARVSIRRRWQRTVMSSYRHSAGDVRLWLEPQRRAVIPGACDMPLQRHNDVYHRAAKRGSQIKQVELDVVGQLGAKGGSAPDMTCRTQIVTRAGDVDMGESL